VTAFLEHIEAHRRFVELLLQEDQDRGIRGAGASKAESAPLADIRRRVEKVVKLGVREGVLRADAADLYPSVLHGIIKCVIVHEGSPRGKVRPELQTATVVRLFLEGAEVRA
jgi:hypothetical protein